MPEPGAPISLTTDAFHRFDWGSTPIGPTESWDLQLTLAVRFILTSKQAMFVLWGEERILIFNDAFLPLVGGDVMRSLGQPARDVWGEVWRSVNPLISDVFAGHSNLMEAIPMTSSYGDGEPRYFDCAYTPLRGFQSDEVIAAVGSVSDVTQRVRATIALEEETELLKVTLENVTQGIAVTDGALRLMIWNEPYREMFSYDQDQMKVGADLRELILFHARRGEVGDGDPEAYAAAIADGMQRGEAQRAEILLRDGRVLDLFGKRIAGGRYIHIARDVTSERRAARLKDELVSTVSHELRTPLTAISASLGLITARGKLDPRDANLSAIALRNCDRLVGLVNDLLDIDKLESGTAQFDFAPVDLRQVLSEAIEQNLPYAQGFGVGLELRLPDDAVIVSADRARLHQVMANLISNAAKFSPRETSIEIQLVSDGATASISVSDHGPGIAPEFRSKLFTRFAQEDATSTRSQSGTGLGLAITKGIVERHGGRITLDEQRDEGATFHVELPVAPPTHP